MAGRRNVVALLVLAAVAVGVAAAFVALRDGDEDSGLAAMSNRGTPIEMAIPERLGAGGRMAREAILIAERGGIRFLRLPRTDGSSCWATGERRSGFWNLTGFRCETGFTRFPDPKLPVMVVGGYRVLPGTQFIVYDYLAGFAADGVKRVGVIDAQDRLIPVTAVLGNLFFTPRPPDRVKAIAALDGAGEIIWRGGEVQLPDE
jgi:hypothetical protein